MTVDQSSVGEWEGGSGMQLRKVGQALSQAINRACRESEPTAIGQARVPFRLVKKPHFPKVEGFPTDLSTGRRMMLTGPILRWLRMIGERARCQIAATSPQRGGSRPRLRDPATLGAPVPDATSLQ